MREVPLVYISVLNWNRGEKTVQCLRRLKKTRYAAYRIFVVDNDSKDDSVRLISEAFPDIRIIRSSSNTGYAAAHLSVAQKADSDNAGLLWILNNDVLVEPDTLETMVEAFLREGDAVYGSVPVGGPESAALPEARVAFPRKFLQEKYREKIFETRPFLSYRRIFPDAADRRVSALPGSSLLIPLSVVRKHGFMDTSYFLYSEEIEYCLRLGAAGVPSILVARSITRHQEGGSTSHKPRLAAVATYYRIRNQLHRIGEYENMWVYCQAIVKDIALAAYYLFSPKHPALCAWYTLLGMRDAMLGRRGKTLAPEDFLD